MTSRKISHENYIWVFFLMSDKVRTIIKEHYNDTTSSGSKVTKQWAVEFFSRKQ